MKKTTRILSLLLALFMLSSFATVFAGAETIAAGDILFTENFDGEPFAIVGSTTYPDGGLMSVAEANGNKSVVCDGGGTSGFAGIQLIPASAMKDQTQYVIHFDFEMTGDKDGWSNKTLFRIGANDDAAGNWIRFYQEEYKDVVSIKPDGYNGDNIAKVSLDAQGVVFSGKNGATVYDAGIHRWAFAVDTVARTLKIYADGTLITEASGDKVSNVIGGLWIYNTENVKFTIDNLAVTAGTYADAPILPGATLFAEDFEGEDYQIVGSVATYPYDGKLQIGDLNDNKSLVYNGGGNSSWSGVQLIPAAALQEQTKVVYLFDLAYTGDNNGWGNALMFRLGALDDIAGNWINMYQDAFNDVVEVRADSYGDSMGTKRYDAQGVIFSGKNGETVYTADPQRFAIELDNVAKTLNVYINGEKVIEASGNGISSVVGGLWMMTQYDIRVAIDNLKVVAGTYENVAAADRLPAMDLTPAPEETLLEKLGWTVNSEFSDQDQVLNISDKIGGESGNQSLKVESATNNYCGMVMVPAEAMTGVTKYVIRFSASWLSGTRITFHMNVPAEHTDRFAGDWAGINYTNRIEHTEYDAAGTKDEMYTESITQDEGFNDFAIEVDLEAGTMKTYYKDMTTPVHTRSITYDTASAISFVVRDCNGYIDDISVVKGDITTVPTAENTLYSEDFQSYDLTIKEGLTVQEMLGWNVDPYYSATGHEMVVSTDKGENNKSLLITETNDAWCGMEIVPAEAMVGVTKYVLKVDVSYIRATRLTFRMNRPEDATHGAAGNWSGLNWTTRMEHTDYARDGASVESLTEDLAPLPDGAFNTLAIAVDLEAKTIKIYWNDMTQPYHTRTIEYDTASAIWMVVRDCVAYVDNLIVYKGDIATTPDANNTIYSEDFESLSSNQEEKPTRPDADYTGKQNGDVIFKDDYNSATTVDELYYFPTVNGGFSAAKVELSDAVNGTPCAKVTGSWSLVELLPVEMIESYDVFTLHMTIKMDSNSNRFTIFYNTADPASTENCGWFEMRYSTLEFYNDARKDGAGVAGKTPSEIVCGSPNSTFTLALSVNCTLGQTYAYLNGELLNFVSGVPTEKSAIYLVVESAVGHIDDLMLTAGSYDDYLVFNGLKEEDPPVDNPPADTGDTVTTETPDVTTSAPTNTEAPATTEAPAAAEKKGCKGSAAITAVFALVAIGAGALVVKKKEE